MPLEKFQSRSVLLENRIYVVPKHGAFLCFKFLPMVNNYLIILFRYPRRLSSILLWLHWLFCRLFTRVKCIFNIRSNTGPESCIMRRLLKENLYFFSKVEKTFSIMENQNRTSKLKIYHLWLFYIHNRLRNECVSNRKSLGSWGI